jgi:hypothetical protein
VTALRLVGELQHWSSALFNRAAAEAARIVGISWLPFLFGDLLRAAPGTRGRGSGQQGQGRRLAVLGLAIGPWRSSSRRKLGLRRRG